VTANLRLVVTMAGRYQASGRLSLADLIQEGNLGLMTAVDRFDPRRGFRFSTYGAWWIRHAIGRALSDTGRTVRLPTHVIELQIKVARARRAFELEHRREPDNAELAARLGVAVEQVDRLDRVLAEPQLGMTIGDAERESPLDQLADEGTDAPSGLDRERLRDQMRSALAELDDSELDIVTKRFGLDGNDALTLREVGAIYHRSRERIRQLQEGALAKVRHALERRGFAAEDAAVELV
jgi:RNA polymerase primary sigma factor